MKKFGLILSVLGLAFSSSLAFADTPPPQTDLVLWHLSTTPLPPAGTHEYCATTQTQPFNPALCFGEMPRPAKDPHPEGYVRVQMSGQVYFLRITGLTVWKFLYRTTGYAQNSDVYVRSIRVMNQNGQSSLLNEQFYYHQPQVAPNGAYNDFGMIRAMIVTGTLPDGTPVNLPNIYMFYQ
ncbi:MAG: hypothetical protein ACJ763_01545 [Bdellovibrionia bacterium]